jgi:hypothetical protein
VALSSGESQNVGFNQGDVVHAFGHINVHFLLGLVFGFSRPSRASARAILGGESGPCFRPLDLNAVRSLRGQSVRARTLSPSSAAPFTPKSVRHGAKIGADHQKVGQ